MSRRTLLMGVLLMVACTHGASQSPATGQDQAATTQAGWIQLFNGRDLAGWTPKFTGSELGVNLHNTFRVENGLLRVVYDDWTEFEGRLGHLFYARPYSHYVLRVEYRFVGQQVSGGPAWALRNNGAMMHAQAPETVAVDQRFPVAVEAQLLGGDGENERTTGNLCFLGTKVILDGASQTGKCVSSTSKTFHGDQWVTLEVEVRGSEMIEHRINGEAVMRYSRPELDEDKEEAQRLLQAGTPRVLDHGYIVLQAETHPTEFRKVELRVLK